MITGFICLILTISYTWSIERKCIKLEETIIQMRKDADREWSQLRDARYDIEILKMTPEQRAERERRLHEQFQGCRQSIF